MEGAVDKLALSGGDIEIALRRPVFQRVGVFTYNPCLLYTSLRFYPLLRPLLLIGAISTLALYLLQGGMMGEGWTDVWRRCV